MTDVEKLGKILAQSSSAVFFGGGNVTLHPDVALQCCDDLE